MFYKSLLQRLGLISGGDAPPVDVTRLEGRSDWPEPIRRNWWDNAQLQHDAAQYDPKAPAPWDVPRRGLTQAGQQYPRANYPACEPSPPWPLTDDPYAKAEPCPIVPDPAIARLAGMDDLRVQAMHRPMQSVKSVTDLIELIERQEAAEKLAIRLGYKWNGNGNFWARIGDAPGDAD